MHGETIIFKKNNNTWYIFFSKSPFSAVTVYHFSSYVSDSAFWNFRNLVSRYKNWCEVLLLQHNGPLALHCARNKTLHCDQIFSLMEKT